MKKSRLIFVSVSLFFMVLLALPQSAAAQNMTLAPHRIVLNTNGVQENLQAIIPMGIPSGYQIGPFSINLYFDGQFVMAATGLEYCYIDDNFFVLYDWDTLVQIPLLQEMAGSTVTANVVGSCTILSETGPPVICNFDHFDDAIIFAPGKKMSRN